MKWILVVLMSCFAFNTILTAEPKTEEEKILYTLGMLLGRNLAGFHLTEKEIPFVLQGISAMATGQKPAVEMNSYGPKIQGWVADRRKKVESLDKAASVKEKEVGTAFLAKKAKESGIVKLPSGILYQMTKEGTGIYPKATDKVNVHYHGTLIDGTVFDSSVDRGKPISFGLNQVIKCWTEGMQKVKVGGKIKLFCPSDLAYGDRGSPPTIKPGATLIFDVELLAIETPPPAAKGPTFSVPAAKGKTLSVPANKKEKK